MASTTSTATESASRRERWLDWLDAQLAMVCLGSLAVVIGGGLIQISFGAYSMTIVEAWRAVVNPAVLFDWQAWNAFLFGAELPEMETKSLIVWNIRLPRVLVGILVGMNLAVSGAIFQAVTRNELASPFILGVSSGAGLMILLTLVVFSGLSAYLPLVASVGGAVAFLIVYRPFKASASGLDPKGEADSGRPAARVSLPAHRPTVSKHLLRVNQNRYV